MKTTLEIRDSLLDDAKHVSNARDLAFRELLEVVLRRELATRSQPAKAPVWEDLSVGGEGLQPPFSEGNWAAILEASYEREPAR